MTQPPKVKPLDPRPLPVDDAWAATPTAPLSPLSPAVAPSEFDPAVEWAVHPTVPIALDSTAAEEAVVDDDAEAAEDADAARRRARREAVTVPGTKTKGR